MRRTLIALLISLLGVGIACQNEPSEQPFKDHPSAAAAGMGGGGMAPPMAGGGAPSAAAPSAAAIQNGPVDGGFQLAGIRWKIPEGWVTQPKKPMRIVSYAIPPVGGDPEPGELAVFYFGAGQGGGIGDNIERWVGQVVQADGSPSKEVAKRETFEVDDLAVSLVDVSGTYLFSANPMASAKVPKPGWRLIAAVVEAPAGKVFFKMVAPVKTAEAAGFRDVITSIERI